MNTNYFALHNMKNFIKAQYTKHIRNNLENV